MLQSCITTATRQIDGAKTAISAADSPHTQKTCSTKRTGRNAPLQGADRRAVSQHPGVRVPSPPCTSVSKHVLVYLQVLTTQTEVMPSQIVTRGYANYGPFFNPSEAEDKHNTCLTCATKLAGGARRAEEDERRGSGLRAGCRHATRPARPGRRSGSKQEPRDDEEGAED